MYEEAAAMTTTPPTSVVNKLNNNALPSIASTSHQLINISSANAANITVAIVSTCDQQQNLSEPSSSSSGSSVVPLQNLQSSASHVAILSGGRKIIINNNSITEGSCSPTSQTTLCLTTTSSSPNDTLKPNNKAIIPNNNSNKTNVIVSTHQIQASTEDYQQMLHQQQQQQQLIITTTVPTVSHQTSSSDSQMTNTLCEVTTLQNLVTTSEQVTPTTSGIIVQANNETTEDGGATSMSADNMVEFDIQDLNNCSTDDTSEANLMTFLYGISAGWASNSLVLLQSDETPLTSGPLTLWEASWVGSILCIGGAIGQVFFGFIADRYGRKPGLAFSFIPGVASWLLIGFGQDFYALFVSRLLAGFVAGAVFQILPMFVSEVSNVEIRGMLGSFLLLFTNLGILMGYIFCAFLPYRIVPWMAIGISFVFLIGFWIVPETPKYLEMKKGEKNDEKLKYSVEFFTGKPFVKEIDVKKTSDEPTSIKLKSLFDVSTRNAFKLSFLLMSCCVFCGVFTVLQYTETIFSEAGSNLSPSISSIIVAVIQLMGSYFATIVVERAGRRILLLSSAYGSAICLGVMGAHSFLKENGFDVSSTAWLPLLCFSLLLFIAANGATTVSFILIGEVFAQNVRGLAITLLLLYQWLLTFLMVLIFPFLIQYLNMSGALWFFTVIETVIASILIFILPETKGRTIEEIVEILRKSRQKS